MTFKASCRVHTVTPHSVLNRKQGVSQCPVFLFLAFNPPPALRRRSTLKSKRRSAMYRTPSLRSAAMDPLRSRRCLQPAACPTPTSSSHVQPDMLRLLHPALSRFACFCPQP